MRALVSLACTLGLALPLVTLSACDKSQSKSQSSSESKGHVALDMASFGAQIEKRENQVMEGPKVSAAMNDLLAALGRDPALAAAGSKLFDRVSADPKVAAAAQTLMGQLTSSPEIQKLVVKVMAEHPEATPDQIGELVGAKFAAVWDSPAVSPAFSRAFDAMLKGLHTQSRFEGVVASMGSRIDAYLVQPDRVGRWDARLRELNNGTDPDAARATQLYIDHAWSAERIEAFMIKLLANPTVRHEAAQTFAEVLELPEIDTQLRAVAGEVASDPAVQAAAVKLMLLLMADPIPPAELDAQLQALLTAPVVTQGLDKLITVVFDNPKIGATVSAHFDKLTADASLRADFDDLIDHW